MPSYYYWFACGIAVLIFFLMRREKIGQRVVISVLSAYLFLVLGSTVFKRKTFKSMQYRLDLFRSYRLIAKKGIYKTRYLTSQVLLNILMLSPIGFLLPVVVKKKWLAILAGFLFSLLIEILQLVLRKGCFELDDLFNNTIGVVIACGFVKLVEQIGRKIAEEKKNAGS